MKDPAAFRQPTRVTLAAALVLAAAFLPWGKIDPLAPLNSAGNLFGTLNSPFGLISSFTITGWNGCIRLASLELPNWLVVPAAIGVAVLSWLRAYSIWVTPVSFSMILAGYGFCHGAFATLSFMFSKEANAQLGAFLTVVAFADIFILLLLEFWQSRPTSPAGE